MLLKDLKARLETINQKEKDLLARHKEELREIKDLERDALELYLIENAKYKVEERVLRKGGRLAQPWIECFIARRIVNQETWDIEYFTYQVKKDGSPGRKMSTWSYPETDFKPYKNKQLKLH